MPQGRKRPDAQADKRIMCAFRILPEELEEIDRAAKALRLTRTDYLIRKGLGQPTGEESYDSRLEALETSVRRLEDLQFSG